MRPCAAAPRSVLLARWSCAPLQASAYTRRFTRDFQGGWHEKLFKNNNLHCSIGSLASACAGCRWRRFSAAPDTLDRTRAAGRRHRCGVAHHGAASDRAVEATNRGGQSWRRAGQHRYCDGGESRARWLYDIVWFLRPAGSEPAYISRSGLRRSARFRGTYPLHPTADGDDRASVGGGGVVQGTHGAGQG